MENKIEDLVKFYQSELDKAESMYDPTSEKGLLKVQYLGEVVDRLHDARMYLEWMEELK